MSINSHINNWMGISHNNYESTCRIQGYDSVCVPCDAGKFGMVEHGKQSCVACLSNTSSVSASTACTECPLHAWAEPGSSECSCNAGYTAHFDAAGNRKAPFCWTCDAGKYKPMTSDSPRASFACADHILPPRQQVRAYSVLQTRRPRMTAQNAHVLLASTVPASMSA